VAGNFFGFVMLTKDLIHWSKEPLREIYSVRQTMLHRKPAGLWFSVVGINGVDEWRIWCREHKFTRPSFNYLTEIILKPGAKMLVASNAAGIDDITAKYGSDGSRLVDWPAISSHYQGIIAAPWVFERSYTRRAGWYETWDCSCGCVWDGDAVARLRCSRNLLLPDEVA
jgi:hypothetical protein